MTITDRVNALEERVDGIRGVVQEEVGIRRAEIQKDL